MRPLPIAAIASPDATWRDGNERRAACGTSAVDVQLAERERALARPEPGPAPRWPGRPARPPPASAPPPAAARQAQARAISTTSTAGQPACRAPRRELAGRRATSCPIQARDQRSVSLPAAQARRRRPAQATHLCPPRYRIDWPTRDARAPARRARPGPAPLHRGRLRRPPAGACCCTSTANSASGCRRAATSRTTSCLTRPPCAKSSRKPAPRCAWSASRGLPIDDPRQLVVPAGIQVEAHLPRPRAHRPGLFRRPRPGRRRARPQIDPRLAERDRVGWYALAELAQLGRHRRDPGLGRRARSTPLSTRLLT